jgi:hypothetical protein
VTIQVTGVRHPVHLPILPVAPSPAADDPEEERTCEDDVVAVLRDSPRRLTKPEIMRALGERGTPWGDRTVAGVLAKLHREHRISNDPDAKPKGYALS